MVVVKVMQSQCSWKSENVYTHNVLHNTFQLGVGIWFWVWPGGDRAPWLWRLWLPWPQLFLRMLCRPAFQAVCLHGSLNTVKQNYFRVSNVLVSLYKPIHTKGLYDLLHFTVRYFFLGKMSSIAVVEVPKMYSKRSKNRYSLMCHKYKLWKSIHKK